MVANLILVFIMKEEEEVEVEFRNLKEFHRCKALENVNEHAFDGIIDNMAKVAHISPTHFCKSISGVGNIRGQEGGVEAGKVLGDHGERD